MTTATDHPDLAAALRGRHLLTFDDYSAEEITYLIDLSAELKAAKKAGREEQTLVGREIALIFEKDSTRTRCAFEVAAASARRSPTSSPSTRAYRSTTGSPTSGTRRRCSPTS
jgi:hypothetical protein